MRDPRDPGGEYERDAGFGFVAPEGRVWTDEDWVNHVLGKHDSFHIGSKVREAIAQRERLGFERYHRPLTKDTCYDNIQEAIEECGDLLFYLVAAHEKHKELCAEKEHLVNRLDALEKELRELRFNLADERRNGDDYIHVHVKQIDLAWDGGRRPKTEYSDGFDAALKLIGIIKCPVCLGMGEVRDVITCSRCHGHGWIIK